MNDRPPLNEAEAEARRQLVAIAHAMHSGEFSFIDGAVQVLHLKAQVGGVGDHDVDFNAFVIIQSETDQLPLEAQRHLWASEALNRLEPEFNKTQKWASSFALESCTKLIARFNHG